MAEVQANSKTDHSTLRRDADSGKYFGAFILISLGIIFLLNTTGILDWGVWGFFWSFIWRFWPLFLVLVGFKIIFGDSKIVSIILGLLFSLIFVTAFVLAAIGQSNSDFAKTFENLTNFSLRTDAGEQKTSTDTVAKDSVSKEPTSREVNVAMTAGNYDFSDSQNDAFFEADATYYQKSGVPELNYELDRENLVIDYTTKADQMLWLGFLGNNKLSYDFDLGSSEVPTDLNFTMTSGNSNFDLNSTNLRNLNIGLTSGSSNLILAEKSIPSKLQIEMTSGSFVLEIPKGTGVNLDYSKTSGLIEVDGERLEKREAKFALNEDAKNTINVNLEMTSGSFEINFI